MNNFKSDMSVWVGSLAVISFLSLYLVPWSSADPLNKFIKQFETLSYDLDKVHEEHKLYRRSVDTSHPTNSLTLELNAYNRTFKLVLIKDNVTFHPVARQSFDGREDVLDLSHLYHGHVEGWTDSNVHGSVISGLFQGKITLSGNEIFYVERKGKYRQHESLSSKPTVHSVIYKETDVVDEDGVVRSLYGSCGVKDDTLSWTSNIMQPWRWDNFMEQLGRSKREIEKFVFNQTDLSARERPQRQSNDPKLTCPLQLAADPELWRHYEEVVEGGTAEVRKEITGLFQYLVRELNSLISQPIVGESKRYQGFNVRITRIMINSSDSCRGQFQRYPLCAVGIDGSNVLNLFSNIPGHHLYCHSQLITYREFDEDTVGLAWVGQPGTTTGICTGDSNNVRSRNTAFTSMVNFGQTLPVSLVRFVFAHEFGHNLGSSHDKQDSAECAPRSANGPTNDQGNFIMYPQTLTGARPNNFRWSPCSQKQFAEVIADRKKTKPLCLIDRAGAFCGNYLVEEGEECDCGFADDCQDCCRCCVPRPSQGQLSVESCKLKRGMRCDPSQGPCCSTDCQLSVRGVECRQETECTNSAICSGTVATCPESSNKADGLLCRGKTQFCRDGNCAESVCTLIQDTVAWQQCVAAKGNLKGSLCYLSCMKGKYGACWSSSEVGNAEFPSPFKKMLKTKLRKVQPVPMYPGAPCDNYRGFCDVFQKCKLLNDLGPLARLTKLVFSLQAQNSLKLFFKTYWYVVLLALASTVVTVVVLTRAFAVNIPSSNPALNLKYKVRRESQQLRALVKKKEKAIQKKLKDKNQPEKKVKDNEMEKSVNAVVDDLVRRKLSSLGFDKKYPSDRGKVNEDRHSHVASSEFSPYNASPYAIAGYPQVHNGRLAPINPRAQNRVSLASDRLMFDPYDDYYIGVLPRFPPLRSAPVPPRRSPNLGASPGYLLSNGVSSGYEPFHQVSPTTQYVPTGDNSVLVVDQPVLTAGNAGYPMDSGYPAEPDYYNFGVRQPPTSDPVHYCNVMTCSAHPLPDAGAVYVTAGPSPQVANCNPVQAVSANPGYLESTPVYETVRLSVGQPPDNNLNSPN